MNAIPAKKCVLKPFRVWNLKRVSIMSRVASRVRTGKPNRVANGRASRVPVSLPVSAASRKGVATQVLAVVGKGAKVGLRVTGTVTVAVKIAVAVAPAVATPAIPAVAGQSREAKPMATLGRALNVRVPKPMAIAGKDLHVQHRLLAQRVSLLRMPGPKRRKIALPGRREIAGVNAATMARPGMAPSVIPARTGKLP